VPAETGFEIGAVSIVKGGPNTEAAKAFVDWVLTRSAGELNVKLSNRLSVRKDVAPAPGAPTLDQAQLVPYDRAWATANKDRILKRWQAAIGGFPGKQSAAACHSVPLPVRNVCVRSGTNRHWPRLCCSPSACWGPSSFTRRCGWRCSQACRAMATSSSTRCGS